MSTLFDFVVQSVVRLYFSWDVTFLSFGGVPFAFWVNFVKSLNKIDTLLMYLLDRRLDFDVRERRGKRSINASEGIQPFSFV